MAVPEVRRVFCALSLIVLLFAQLICAQEDDEGGVIITPLAFKPKGFRISIKDLTNTVKGYYFNGYLNSFTHDPPVTRGDLKKNAEGFWVFEDPQLKLNIGDRLNYYLLEEQSPKFSLFSFDVTELRDLDTQHPDCRPSLTKVRGGKACAGQTIFEDNFDTLREEIWQIEQYIPVTSPESPFVSYQRLTDNPTVAAINGTLHITPKLQERLAGFTNESIYSGTLDLFNGCTADTEACVREASGADILPPVVSGRITSKGFAFTYGTVHIRAKLPQGDWLYPELLLEPFLKKYGNLRDASGVVKIATARGNRQLNVGANEYGNKVLYGGIIMDLQCRDNLLSSKMLTKGRLWGDDYHVYSVRWAPEAIVLSVDDEEWARIEPTETGLASRFPNHCDQLPRSLLAKGLKMAPFDDHFYITLGLAAGSVTEFRDGATTEGDRPKPWNNQGRKAMFYFWQDTDAWLKTWNQPELLIDYVKVVALNWNSFIKVNGEGY